MKKLLAAAILVVASVASAAWEKVGEVQIAGRDGLVAAANRLGTMLGNPTIGPMAAKGLDESSLIEDLGPTRPGAAIHVPQFVDGAKLAENPTNIMECLEFALVYPVVATKEKFLKHHTDAVETNGFVRLKLKWLGESCCRFSEDGKWLVISDKPEQIMLALKDLPKKERPLGDSLLRLRVNERGMQIVRKAIAAHSDELGPQLAFLDGLVSAAAGIGVTGRGIDFRLSLKIARDSALDPIGRETLPSDPLAFAGRDCIAASAYAPNSRFKGVTDGLQRWNALKPVLQTNGIETGWIDIAETGKVLRCTFDTVGMARWINGDGTNVFERLDLPAFSESVKAALNPLKAELTVKSPERYEAVSFKGYSSPVSPAERLAALMPEMKDRKPFCVSVISLVSMLEAILPAMAELLPEQAEVVQTFGTLLPKDHRGGIGGMWWREGDTLVALTRISSEELKGFGGIGTLVAMQLMQARQAADEDDDCDDDCDGDDSSDDDADDESDD